MILRATLTIAAATFLSATALGCADTIEIEGDFVACLSKKRPALISEIRDATSEGAFLVALKKGVAICPIDQEQMSMGLLFKALGAYKAEKSEAAPNA